MPRSVGQALRAFSFAHCVCRRDDGRHRPSRGAGARAEYSLLDTSACSSRIMSVIVLTLSTTGLAMATAIFFALSSATGHKEGYPALYQIRLPSAEVVNHVTFGHALPPDPTCTWKRADTPAQICSHDTELEGERKCPKFVDELALLRRGGTTEVDDGMPAINSGCKASHQCTSAHGTARARRSSAHSPPGYRSGI
jgi:hypothetical protein